MVVVASLVLTGAGWGGSAVAPGHGILLLGYGRYDEWRIFLWHPGSPRITLTESAPTNNGGDFDVRMSDGFWSPDGRSIAYEQDAPGGLAPPTPSVIVMRSDGLGDRTLASDRWGEDEDGPPSWSPDGRHIVYNRYGSFVIVDVRSGHKHRLGARGRGIIGDPAWGRAGIAYTSGSTIMLLNPGTGRSRRVMRGVPRLTPLAWSPDGVLAVVEPTGIVLLAASGRVLGKFLFPGETKAVCAVAWSPHGQLLVAGGVTGILGLWVGTVSTKRWRRLPPVPTRKREPNYECALSWR